MKNLYIVWLFVIMTTTVYGQVGINSDGTPPDNSAMLDVKSQVKGFLPPRVTLMALNIADPLLTPASGLFVYNTATAGTIPNNVIPGYYCWNGSRWVAVIAPLGTNPGDMLYWNGTQYVGVPAGLPGQFLQMSSSYVPTWAGAVFATIITYNATNIAASSAMSGGNVTADGGSAITAKGICYNTSPNPTTANSKVLAGTGTGSFSSTITGLIAGTTYYIRAYAINNSGTSYGNEITFTTLSNATLPSVFTNAITAITASTATGGGTVNNSGGATVTARGVCYSTSPTPTILNSLTINGTGTGGFWSYLTGLTPNTFYYVRAYATNVAGTGYGNEVTFTTNCSSNVPVSLSIAASANPVCVGISVSYTATPTNGGTTPAYQWKVNSTIVSGATNATYAYFPVNGDAVTCVLTSNAQCVTGNPATSNSITMTVSQLLPVSILIAASANPVCVGTSVSFTATPTNGGTAPSYQWKINGINANGATNANYTYIPANSDAVSCVLTSNALCTTGNPTTSNTITIVVNSGLPVSVSVAVNFNPVCTGTTVILTATGANGGTNPTYEWRINNIPIVGATNSQYQYVPNNNDVITCLFTSSLACVTGGTATSNQIVMIVSPLLPVSCTIITLNNPACLGESVCFNAIVTNGGSSTTYRWKVNGIIVSTLVNNPNFCYVPVNGDMVSCQVISNAQCASPIPVNSNVINMVVNSQQPVSISITASANPVISGTSVTFTATPVNGGTTPVYQWKINGVNVGTNALTYSYIPANNDSIKCILTSNQTCITGSPATSNLIVLAVNLMNIPCPGTPTVTYGGKTYNTIKIGTQCWLKENLNFGTKINGNQQQTNNSILEKYCYNDLETNCSIYGGLYQWNELMNYMTTEGSQGICPTGWHVPTDGEWTILTVHLGEESVAGGKMKSTGTLEASTGLWNSPNTGATNESGFTAFPAGYHIPGGNFSSIGIVSDFWSSSEISTNYTWIRAVFYYDNSVLRTDASGYGFPLRCLKDTCTSYSNAGVTIGASANSLCNGSIVTFTANPVNGGSNPSYQWKVNGVNAGTNSPIYSFIPANGDAVSCVLTSNQPCIIDNPSTSNTVNLIVSPLVAVNLSIAASQNPSCTGSSVTFTAMPVNGGSAPSYQWKVNGISINGEINATYVYVPANGDAVNCVMTSNASCITGNPATSNVVNMTVNPASQVSVSIVVSANPFTSGSSVTFTATGVNAGTSPTYQWKVNGVDAGVNNSTYSYIPVNNDIVICIITANPTECIIGSPATSNQIVMTMASGVPCPGIPTVVYGGKTYNTVQIGTQCWFKENLNVGTMINGVVGQTNNGTIEKYCFNNLESNCDIYGGLYQWNEMMSYNYTIGSQGACPSGWHIPMNEDWDSLSAYLGGEGEAGGKMKTTGTIETGTGLWIEPNAGATNESGFSATPSGLYYGVFYAIGEQTILWSATNSSNGHWREAVYYSGSLHGQGIGGLPKDYGLSARCIKNTCTSYSSVSISIAPSANQVCAGTAVSFVATPINGGSSPSFQWKVNGVNITGATNASYTYYPPTNNSIACVLTTNAPCVVGSPVTSSSVSIIVNTLPNPTISGPAAACIGNNYIYSTQTGNTNYTWNVIGGVITAGAGTNSINVTWNTIGTQSVTVNYTNANGCAAATSTFKPITVNALPVISIIGEPSVCIGYTGNVYSTQPGMTNYLWSVSAGGAITSGGGALDNTVTITWNTAGAKTVSVNYTNAFGCYALSPVISFVTVKPPPSSPISGAHVPSQNQIIWNWNAVEGATGYKWNATDNYNTAIDMGINTSTTETSLTCNSQYSRYLWAYSICGVSAATMLSQATSGTDISAPSSGIHIPSLSQIVWKWTAVSGATGYRWNTTNDFANAIDMGLSQLIAETGLICNTSYTRFVWSYKECGNSTATILTKSTSSSFVNSPTAGAHVPATTQIVWNWNTVSEAAGYKWNTTNDYASAIDMGNATTKTETSLTCNTSYTRYAWAFNSCGNSTPLTMTTLTSVCPWSCTQSITINHVAGVVSPVNKSTTYGTVSNIPGEPGKCWITQNLGADHQASSVDDATEASAGWYWQFNRKQGYKHDGAILTPSWTLSIINENSDWITLNDPCSIELSNGWRIPTYSEWFNVDVIGGWTDWNGPWNSGLKIHGSGILLYATGELLNRGWVGACWSSKQTENTYGWEINYDTYGSTMSGNRKALGNSLRCLRDN